MKVLWWLVLLLTYSLVGIDYDWNKWQEQCNPEERTQLELNKCAHQQFLLSDSELNDTYKLILRSLRPEQQQQLRAEQGLWLKARDSKCRAQADDEAAGGSIWPMLYELCRASVTQHRTQELRDWKS
ncbi:lysozyme inhibitor LprI family protein [uncultured Microbulbifer sp.]|uniref:lysozyme inhibitor LprI family protein n=1 Tax=uncultured Microbulbifer sp. TaxID=348147 RepID=UPI0026122265|nr:lysozyme inhibitor LprI family protein [uncultured Microbulbifer sp.]